MLEIRVMVWGVVKETVLLARETVTMTATALATYGVLKGVDRMDVKKYLVAPFYQEILSYGRMMISAFSP